jgi:hypothetical protein
MADNAMREKRISDICNWVENILGEVNPLKSIERLSDQDLHLLVAAIDNHPVSL